jgi:molybdenum cofactor cytidylyltransferase
VSDKHFAIILAAGASRRMGTCKAALPWREGQTLLAYQAQQWLLARVTPIVVLGVHNARCQKDCPATCQVAINRMPEAGKTGSILIGLRSLPPDFATVAISAVDQPRSTQIYQTLLQAHQRQNAPITAPIRDGCLGHPLIFSKRMLGNLHSIREETAGLRQVVRHYYPAIQKVPFNTPEIFIDLNTPEQYRDGATSWQSP